MSNVIDGQRADTLDSSDLIINSSMNRGEVRRSCELASDSLKPRLDLFEENARNPTLVRVTLAARQLAKRGLSDRRRRAALNFKESLFLPRVVAVFMDIVADNLVKRQGCS